jgi:hypothetical protein
LSSRHLIAITSLSRGKLPSLLELKLNSNLSATAVLRFILTKYL